MPFEDNTLAVLTQCANPIVGDNQPAVFVRVAMLDPTQFPADSELTIDRPRSRPGSGRFARYLLAICIGVVGTLAWQSYGDAAKEIMATRAPELGWSPEAKQMIASWTLGWRRPPAGPEKTASEAVAPKASPAPSVDPAQVQQIAQSLAALRETVEQIAAGQDQTTRQIARLESAVADLILKIPEPPAQLPSTPARKPMPVPPSSRAPTAPQSSRTHAIPINVTICCVLQPRCRASLRPVDPPSPGLL